jgi:hypothetical protein
MSLNDGRCTTTSTGTSELDTAEDVLDNAAAISLWQLGQLKNAAHSMQRRSRYRAMASYSALTEHSACRAKQVH